jgi:hypothetical protein
MGAQEGDLVGDHMMEGSLRIWMRGRMEGLMGVIDGLVVWE